MHQNRNGRSLPGAV